MSTTKKHTNILKENDSSNILNTVVEDPLVPRVTKRKACDNSADENVKNEYITNL